MACVETRYLGGADYFESADLPHGFLPTKKAVIEVILYPLRPRRAEHYRKGQE